MKDKRSVEERVAYHSYVGLCCSSDQDSAAYQEGWDAARDGILPTKNPYALTTYKKVYPDRVILGEVVKGAVHYPIRGGKARVDKHCLWMNGYNAWQVLFGKPFVEGGSIEYARWVFK
jgi:hypothetical protein